MESLPTGVGAVVSEDVAAAHVETGDVAAAVGAVGAASASEKESRARGQVLCEGGRSIRMQSIIAVRGMCSCRDKRLGICVLVMPLMIGTRSPRCWMRTRRAW